MKPQKIRLQKAAESLEILWDNGEQKDYSFSVLRDNCPCADCRKERENEAEEPDILNIPIRSSDWKDLEKVELVGNYAVQLVWKDGHQHGIYSWNYLYALPSRSPGKE